jgi:hypothetical protein
MFIFIILSGCEKLNEKVYHVYKVGSYHPQSNENTQVDLIVYKNGSRGYVEEIFCEFPPNYILSGNKQDGWTGIEKVRVKGKAREWMLGRVSYYCEDEK